MLEALTAVLIFAGIIASFVGIPVLAIWFHDMPDRKAAKRAHELALEKEKTKQLEIQQKIVDDYK